MGDSRACLGAVIFYDIFNGDADGICALHQLRMSAPRSAELVTGVKRDVRLLRRVAAGAGDELTVLDISLAENLTRLEALLAAGARCLYFDHHFPGTIPAHPNLAAHIRCAPDVCTSLLVDEFLAGRFRRWAVVAAFGDNLPRQARLAAAHLGLTSSQLDLMRELGECINYNAYGDTLKDLHFHPAELYRRIHAHADPLEFAATDPTFATLKIGYRQDMASAGAVEAELDTPSHYAVVLPDAVWARRVHGAFANALATANPNRAHAVAVSYGDRYRVSIRAPVRAPRGADVLCRQFSGGGRPGAGGVDDLLPAQFDQLIRAFQLAFRA